MFTERDDCRNNLELGLEKVMEKLRELRDARDDINAFDVEFTFMRDSEVYQYLARILLKVWRGEDVRSTSPTELYEFMMNKDGDWSFRVERERAL